MSNTEVMLYVFLAFLALFFILVGREFIRARRRRAPEDGVAGPSSDLEPAQAEETSVKEEAAGVPESSLSTASTMESAAAADIEPELEKAEAEPVPALDKAEAKPEKAEAAEPEKAALTQPVPKPVAEGPKPVRLELLQEEPEAQRLKKGLTKTRKGFVARLGSLFRAKKTIDQDLLDQLEEVLLTADIGVHTSEMLFKSVKEALDRKSLKDPEAIWSHIKARSVEILDINTKPPDSSLHKPFVILTVGVNGVGKTTTIGKLASRFQSEKKNVLLAAGDTFRAAAVEQLQIWGERTGSEVVAGKQGADPSSVVFDAIKRAKDKGADVVIADTAGRLHTKVELMEELRKIHRVMGKALQGSPHETYLILDATTGQNAIQQAHLFQEVVQVTGIILTKLDGTAKGGIILGICDELKIPVRYVGIGERVEDLREFNSAQFVEALYAEAQEA